MSFYTHTHTHTHTLPQFEQSRCRVLRAPVFHPQGHRAESSRGGCLDIRICCSLLPGRLCAGFSFTCTGNEGSGAPPAYSATNYRYSCTSDVRLDETTAVNFAVFPALQSPPISSKESLIFASSPSFPSSEGFCPLLRSLPDLSFYNAKIGNLVKREFKTLEEKEEDLEGIN